MMLMESVGPMSRLNVQGLARRDAGLMKTLIPEPGFSFVSIDLSAGEPTVVSHYSRDVNYTDACFNLAGKEPYYDENGILKIDDIYLTACSFSPVGRDRLKEAYNSTYDGKTFSETWLSDPEFLKNALKRERDLHKVLVLGIGYSMGPKKMVKSCYDKGFTLSQRDAKEFYGAYWRWCPNVKRLSERLSDLFRQRGHLINDFGYRLVPDKDYKALNYWIQSTVSGIMNALIYKYFTIFPTAQFVALIHDEIIIQVPTPLLADAKAAMDKAVQSLNEDLKWSVAIRTGWKEGQTLYEAK